LCDALYIGGVREPGPPGNHFSTFSLGRTQLP
jgi:hypothetical protein